MGAAFDTSGRVRRGVITPRGTFSFRPGFVRWPDLSPFTQGYVEALFADEDCLAFTGAGYRHLAPETLARTMEDCEAYALRLARPLHDDRDVQRRAGAGLWRMRSRRALNPGLAALLPPLTPYLGDDGKIYLKPHPPGGHSHEG